jgi:endoglucanase
MKAVRGELSHGLASLRASRNRIVNATTSELVTLRGVNRSGLEYAEPGEDGFLPAAGISRDEIGVIVDEWGANIIRLPFNQDWALNGRGNFTPEDYRQALDNVISWAAELGAYTLLDLQWLDADRDFGHNFDGSVNRVAPLPNAASIELWKALAERYREEPAVLFDLFNEPHSPLEDDANPITFVDADGSLVTADTRAITAQDWNRWAARLTEEIRKIHPSSLLFVSGVDWGFDFTEIRLDVPNLVYSAHVYPNRKRVEWSHRFGFVCVDRPLFIGEWGGGADDLHWGSLLATYISRFACGWTAWSWSDFPRLVSDAQSNEYQPTEFGSLVRSELARQTETA